MKLYIKIFLFLIFSTFVIKSKAQDYKFSQFYNSPLNLNPALTGKVNSLYRFVANYRLQYFPVQSPSPYNTLSASADFGILRDKLKGDIFGVGILFTNDRQTAIRSNTMMASVAYNKSLGKDKNHFLGVGIQIGFLQRHLDFGNLAFASQFDSINFRFDLTKPNGENFATGKYFKPNLNIGLFWTSNFTKSIGAYAGLSIFNIIRPKDSFFKENNERSMRFNAQAGLFIDVKQICLISPNGMYMYQAKAQQWIVGSSFAFNLSGKKEPYKTAVSAGVWYDGNGAVIASTGVSFSGMQIGLSYDATVKKELTKAVKSFGAFEVSLIYTGKALEKKKSYSPLLCPKF
ncbi:MAG TPA: PorP/SprF family type IX secretion system membrane protein [Chitinophagales bacterium]|jgi:type IX secretion system PorP/SprF family membrane protein|nr:PorP/SprF family type IX secretion system membrane protein [Chitinophagales bacterium]MBP6153630.1 PorP/SprF family type IX secretion system membrane protein [Chitinophagales bacterium]HQV77110.1 PorP/SprF family type IX secretion system membrane protein [Chitinophagales bacterium]HQW77824.1 PorP/SprF family type IX secretion system membrane protein [Chitinophagales bacterium]HRB66263.1 PorP/SprF family type IX secretion system membrane protein [Chitinophagales bacterium]